MDCWIFGWMDGLDSSRTVCSMEYTKRKNLNRGYMKLDAWQRGMDLFVMAFRLTTRVSDLKLRSQFRDAAQSVSSNIAEGYGRRSLPEYLQYLYIAKGSLAETLTRAIGFRTVEVVSESDFEAFDSLHYEIENKLLRLIESLETKRETNDWRDTLPSKNPSPQKSTHPVLPK